MMKKLLATMMALVMIVTLSQCKKQNEENEDNTAKVRISCTIPLNNDGKTDFTSDGTVNWSAGVESIYLAIPHETAPQIVELTSELQDKSQATLTFTGSVQANLLTNGTYDVWYLGNSKHTGNSYIEENIEKDVMTSINGAISAQSGSLSDLGKCHIAKATVTASVSEGGATTLNFNGNGNDNFKNQVAIVRLGEGSSNTKLLRGNAVIGTEYALMYEDGEYKFNVTKSSDAKISVTPQTEGESYVVVFPNTNNNVELISDSGKKVTFLNGINAGSMYTVGWENYEGINGYEYVDLGLPSGLKWAKYNVGANTPEAYGDYFAWGEIETKDTYTMGNCSTDGVEMNGISGKAQFDAATANWGEGWRMPTQWEMQELVDECDWEWTNDGVAGYKVRSKTNRNNYIFLPAAGFYNADGNNYIDQVGSYWTSTPLTEEVNSNASLLLFNINVVKLHGNPRECGRAIRPVYGGKFARAEVTTAGVTNIKDNSAVCGGNVTEDHNYTVIERGVCWSTSQEPTIEDNKKAAENAGEGEYTVTLEGLTAATIYYVRAYAINEAGISYGLEVRFTTTKTTNNYVYDFSNMGSHAVDLGLPSGVLWSDCNIGAEWAVEQDVWPENIYGNYFMWACRTSSLYFGEGNYPDYAKACRTNYSGNATYDAATNLYGGNWRTPTEADFEELISNCDYEFVTKNEIKYVKFTSRKQGNNNSIYLPLAGQYGGYQHDNLNGIGSNGNYLTTDVPYNDYDCGLCRFMVLRSGDCEFYSTRRWSGLSIRPVIGPIPAED